RAPWRWRYPTHHGNALPRRLASLPLAPLPPASALSSSQPQPWLLTGFQGRCLKGSQHGFRLGNSSRRLSNVTIAAERPQESTRWTGTRKVMEHLVLYKMKGDITDEQEKDMLDHLYSLQYHYRGILAVSLGSVVERMPEGVTHAFSQRFPSFEALEQYMDHPARLKITDEFISPFCKSLQGIIEADFEAEVEDDLEPLFRRGDLGLAAIPTRNRTCGSDKTTRRSKPSCSSGNA
ncbi:hypothetical protein KC19_3G008300, partial [Ceratodon purpureus]